MTIIEVLATIAAIITIGGVILYIGKWPLRPYFEYRRVMRIIKTAFNEWKMAHYSHRRLIKYDDFLIVNQKKDKLKSLTDEELAFLLRCSVQNGMGGNWGYWAVRNGHNDKAIFPLVKAIDEMPWRPRWRAAYILESTFGRHINIFFEKLPNGCWETENIETICETISSTSVEEYLRGIVTDGSDASLATKAENILDEIKAFSDAMKEYREIRERRSIENLSRTVGLM